ncbi:MAG: tRNA pseudouridine(13) synthase TruD, partial [Candidatus Bathyarchaeia archaeon]
TFSIPIGKLDRSEVDLVIRRIQKEFPITVNWTRLHTNKLRVGHLIGNRFTVTITEIDVPSKVALERAERIASLLRVNGLPNYFGPQRFGIDGSNVRRGYDIVLGNLKVGDRWLRRFLVNSYQSYLCNMYLALRVRRGLFHRVIAGDFARKYTTRSWFEVVDEEKEQRRYEAHEISFTAPVYGFRMPFPRGLAGELELEVLADFGLKLENFEPVKAFGSRRIGRIIPKDLVVKKSPDGLTLSFILPRGGFATTVLREFMKTDSTPESYRELPI